MRVLKADIWRTDIQKRQTLTLIKYAQRWQLTTRQRRSEKCRIRRQEPVQVQDKRGDRLDVKGDSYYDSTRLLDRIYRDHREACTVLQGDRHGGREI
jgi:hypothetical protein